MRTSSHLPPLSALRAFEAAARLQSFSKAADELMDHRLDGTLVGGLALDPLGDEFLVRG